ncbi:MAG: hypothetical protein A2487_03580, partial [Candidatus Raymondbacteria bacterium RifOxyC12_full_50_8]
MSGIGEIGFLHSSELFLKNLEKKNPEADLALVKKALTYSYNAHRNQFRKSGGPFQTHAIEVARILTDQKMDANTVCAGLLHDVIENTEITYEDIKKEFNETVANLVDGVTNISNIPFKSTEELQIETYRKMLISTAKDIRVIIIKFADRLHNLRTLKYLDKAKIRQIAQESMNVYVPLAHRMGMARIRWEMEDLSFKYLYPADYDFLLTKFADTRAQRDQSILEIRTIISGLLQKHGIEGTILGRSKHLFSIFKKIQSGKIFEEIYDLFAIRIVVRDVIDCYKVLGIIHSIWIPVQNRFKDYIATPKSNKYQSLHTAVIGPKGRMLEIQIRTEEMNQIAEAGIAAHWIYKENKEAQHSSNAKSWIKELADLPKDLANHDEFMDFFKVDLFQSEIFVFTPKGDLVQLPKGSTILDFAFSVHSDMGLQCIAGKINGKAYPINTVLRSGSTVEIIKASFQTPTAEWLNWVTTIKAKRDIRHWLKQKSHAHKATLGKELFERELLKIGATGDHTEKLYALFPHFKIEDINELYFAIGNGDIPALLIIDRIYPQKQVLKNSGKSFFRKLIASPKKSPAQAGLAIKAPDSTTIHFGKCCQPLPGDKISGYLVKDRGVEIHRTTCTHGMMLMGKEENKIEVSWDPQNEFLYRLRLQVIARNSMTSVSDITRGLATAEANIIHAHIKRKGALTFQTYQIELSNRHHLNKIFR